MAISSNTILDSMEWAKRFVFNRRMGLGNNLEPAKTSATVVMQTILSPPFDWWWNNQEVTFTTNPTPATANTTGTVVVLNGVATFNIVSKFPVQSLVLFSAFAATLTALDGQSMVVLTNTGSQVTGTVNVPDATYTDTGTLTAGTTQDYAVSIPNFSHIEHASVLDISKKPPSWIELQVKGNLALDSNVGRPDFISPHYEDANGNVTFRLMKAPGMAYPVSIHAQLTAPVVTSLNQTWAPIPDFMEYVYNWGFLAMMWTFADDPRAQMAHQRFIAALLGRAEGLTETERNIFLNNWNDLTSSQKIKEQQGINSRSV